MTYHTHAYFEFVDYHQYGTMQMKKYWGTIVTE